MSYKRLSCVILMLAAGVLIFTVAFWHLKVARTFYNHDGHGDLSRLGSYEVTMPDIRNPEPGSGHESFQQYAAENSHTHYDVVTIGDSLFNGGGGNYAQDYLAMDTGASILNASRLGNYNQLDHLWLMERCGWLDRIRPKVVILELGARSVRSIPYITRDLAERTTAYRYRQNVIHAKSQQPEEQIPLWTLVNTRMGTADIKYLKDHIMYRENPRALSEEVERWELTVDMFSNPGHRSELLTYVEESAYQNPGKRPEPEKINTRLNEIAVWLGEKGIRLAVVIVPTKLDVYYPWIKEKHDLPENTFYDNMHALPKKYLYVDGFFQLRQAAAAGEKDLYWQDDTHWSFKAQQIVMKQLACDLWPQLQ